MITAISCDNLGLLDGGTAKAAIDQAIARALLDLDDRGSDGKPRKVKIDLNLCRLDNGKSTQVAAHVEVGIETPKYRTGFTIGSINRGKKTEMLFNDMSPDDDRQRTIDERLNQEEE